MCVENDYIWNPATCSCENGKYLGIIINDSVITRYEIIEKANVSTNFINEKVTYKTKQFYILLFFIHYYSIIDTW